MMTPPTETFFRIRATSRPGWALTRNLPRDPAFAAGWHAFDERMRSYDARRMAELQACRDETRERAAKFGGAKRFTKGNFLRNLVHEASELAFHHGVTGSPQSLAAVRHIIGWLGEEPVWSATESRTRKADLWTADFATYMGLAHMWTRDALPAETRRLRGEWLMERGIRPLLADWIDPRTRIHALDTMGHNWWSVCAGGAAVALFALRDERPEADEWLQRIADGFVAFFDYPGNVLQNKHRTFGRQGDFIESIGYLDYTFQNLVLLFDLYREALGRDLAAEIPVLERVCDYYLASVQPIEGGLQRLNFGDMGCGKDTVGAYNHHPTPVWLWLADRFQRGALMEMVRRTHPRPSSFAEFLLWPETPPPGGFETAPGDVVFDNIGVAVLRDGYADDASVFAIKTGEKWNHNQADAGSFILSAKGREFIVDTGVTEYSSPLFLGYFATSHAHNVVLHDGRGQRDELGYLGTKFMGAIAGRLFSPGYRYLLADATGPWEGVYTRFYRHVLWIGDCIVMVDDLMAGHAAPLTQLLHYRGTAASSENRTRIENGGKTLTVHHLFPPPERFETRDGHHSTLEPNPLKYDYRVEKWPYLAVHYASADRRSKIVQVFELPDGAARSVEKWEEPGILGIRIRTPGDVWTIACNQAADGRVMHDNPLVRIDTLGLETDAFLIAEQRAPDGTLLSLAIHNGSLARRPDRVLFSSLLKGDLRIVHEREGATVHGAFSAAARLELAPDQGPASARTLALPAGQHVARLEW